MTHHQSTFTMFPIGHVNASEGTFSLQIAAPYRKGLQALEHFGHILVFWWATEQDHEQGRGTIETELPYAPGVKAGVFACRSEYRPNPIAMTVCAIQALDLEKGLISVPYMDAFDKTPIVDLKPYMTVSERVREVKTAPWMKDWPQYYEEAYKLVEIFSKLAP